MKTIIAGGRNITRMADVIDAIRMSGFFITEVVSGTARGIDTAGEWLAKEFLHVPVKLFPADWEKYGKAAGHVRNAQMAEYGEALILIWDGKSKGSANMLANAKKRNLKIYQHIV